MTCKQCQAYEAELADYAKTVTKLRQELDECRNHSKRTDMKVLNKQIGGEHYKNFPIQPIEFVHINYLGFIEGCVIKYLCRWRQKDGIKDLEKAKHYLEMLIELESK